MVFYFSLFSCLVVSPASTFPISYLSVACSNLSYSFDIAYFVQPFSFIHSHSLQCVTTARVGSLLCAMGPWAHWLHCEF